MVGTWKRGAVPPKSTARAVSLAISLPLLSQPSGSPLSCCCPAPAAIRPIWSLLGLLASPRRTPRAHVYSCVCARFCAHARACTDSRATPLFPTHVHVHVRVRVRVRVRACACVCVRVRLPCVHRRMRRASHGIHTSHSEVTANLDPEAVDHIFLHLARRAVQPQPRGSTESTCQGTSTACGFCTTSPVETLCIFGHSLVSTCDDMDWRQHQFRTVARLARHSSYA